MCTLNWGLPARVAFLMRALIFRYGGSSGGFAGVTLSIEYFLSLLACTSSILNYKLL